MRLKKERDDERYTGEPESPQEPGQPNRTSEENTPEKGDQIEKKRGNPIKRAYYYCVNRIYRYLYFVGIQLLRSTRTRRRHLSVRLSGLGRWFQARSLRLRKETRIHLRNLRHELTSPIRDLKEKRRRFRVELENARKFSGEAGVYRSYLRMAGLLLTGFWRAAGFVLSYLAPLTALIALVLLLQFFSGLTLALNLVYDGRDLGYIADESVFTQAENEMKARIVNEQYIKPEDIIPRFQITILKKGGSFLNPDDYITEDDLLEVDELTNLLIRASGNELEEAVGLYVENRFVSAVMDGDALLDYLDSMREQYRTNDMSRDAEISFMKKIQVKKGLYPVSSVKPFEQLAEILSSEEEGRTVFGSRVMMSSTVLLKNSACHFSIARRISPSVIRPHTLLSSSDTPKPSLPLLTSMIASPRCISFGITGMSSDCITSAAVVSRRFPSSPPGWNCAKSRGLKSRICMSATAKASPIMSAAVVLLVGARFNGHASFLTFTVI